jgi:FkbM family methyltransferase
MPDGLPLRLRIQFTVTRWMTRLLAAVGLREPVIRAHYALARARRGLFERLGSTRYSRPALYEIDRKLDAIIDRNDGFFVEVGGHDGFTQSNTYYLERFRGWRGILVEPMPEMTAEARRNRPEARLFQCALVGPDHEGREIEMQFGDLFTTIGGRDNADAWAHGGLVLGWRDPRVELVPARSLSSVLDEAGVRAVDLLSLDVEGYEAQVLTGLDLSRHAPAWILIEMHDLEAGREAIGAVLGDAYVEQGLLSPLDVLYRRADVDRPERERSSSARR